MLCVVVSTGRNRVLGSHASHYSPEKRHVSALCLQTLCHIGCFERNRKSLELFVVDSEDSDWLAWLHPPPYTAAHRSGIVRMALNGIFMRVDVNCNFFENYVVCTMLFLKTEGGKFLFL